MKITLKQNNIKEFEVAADERVVELQAAEQCLDKDVSVAGSTFAGDLRRNR